MNCNDHDKRNNNMNENSGQHHYINEGIFFIDELYT
jgi:hypothetical protein